MAWPIDARNVSYGALQSVPSDNLNEIQDRIVDLHEPRNIIIKDALCGDTAGVQDWTPPTSGFPYWTAVVASPLMFVYPMRQTAILNSVDVKVYNVGAAQIRATVYRWNDIYSTPASAPTNAVIGGFTVATLGTSWDVIPVSGLSAETIDADESIVVVMTTAAVGDFVASVKLNIQPLTPTP